MIWRLVITLMAIPEASKFSYQDIFIIRLVSRKDTIVMSFVAMIIVSTLRKVEI
jgi:hypothetical protein